MMKKIIKNRFLTCFILPLVLSCNAFAVDLNEAIVVNSSLKHYPKIYNSEEKIRIAEAKLTEARGEFDSKLNIKQKQFLSGYYKDYGYLESKLVKPIGFLNANLYSGYTLSQNGVYPEVNNYYNTGTDGRALFGFEFSILRGFLINERIAANKIAKIESGLSNLSNKLVVAQVKNDARKSYWKFFYLRKILNLYEEQLDIAKKRNESIAQQVKNGDKPKIAQEESFRVVLRRMSLLENIKREYFSSAVSLSLYLRDNGGNMGNPEEIIDFNLTDEDFVNSFNFDTIDISKDYVALNRLDVLMAKEIIKQGDVRIKLVQNDILPSVDFVFETSMDYGSVALEKRDRLNKIGVNISIPIENKKQIGKYSKVKSENKILKNDLKFLQDTIKSELNNMEAKIKELKEVFVNTGQEVVISKNLLDAEIERFNQGDSDFFLLNAREQDFLFVNDYHLRVKLALVEVLIEYLFATKDSVCQVVENNCFE